MKQRMAFVKSPRSMKETIRVSYRLIVKFNRMKKIIIITSFVMGLSTILSGCKDYLDSDYLFDERMTIENVFSSRDYTNEWLARAYSYLGSNYLQDVASKKNVPFN